MRFSDNLFFKKNKNSFNIGGAAWSLNFRCCVVVTLVWQNSLTSACPVMCVVCLSISPWSKPWICVWLYQPSQRLIFSVEVVGTEISRPSGYILGQRADWKAQADVVLLQKEADPTHLCTSWSLVKWSFEREIAEGLLFNTAFSLSGLYFRSRRTKEWGKHEMSHWNFQISLTHRFMDREIFRGICNSPKC